MHGLAVVPQRFLSESFRVSAGLRTFCPSIAVGMQGDALNHQAAAGAGKLRRPMRFPHGFPFGKKGTRLRQCPQDVFEFCAKPDYGHRPGLVAVEAHDLASPVNVLGAQARNVGLSAAQMPAKFIKCPALRVRFACDDGLVFLPRDRPLLLEADFRPLFFREHRPRQPTHVEGEIVKPTQKHVCCHGTSFKHFQELRGVGFQNRQVTDDVKSPVLHCPLVADERRPGLGAGHLIHRRLPGALGDLRVGRGQIRPGDVEIKHGLPVGFVLGMQEREGLGFVLGAEAVLLASGRVLTVKNARSAEQYESRFHR